VGQATRKRNRIARANKEQDRLVKAFSDKIRQMRELEKQGRQGMVHSAALARQLRFELKRDLGMNPDDVEIEDV
jgi:hypothetical protein